MKKLTIICMGIILIIFAITLTGCDTLNDSYNSVKLTQDGNVITLEIGTHSTTRTKIYSLNLIEQK